MAGTLLGGTIGAGSVLYFSTDRFASIENFIGIIQGKKIIRIGPHKNPNFPWILLDRALLHFKSIRDLAHSRRDKISLAINGSEQRIASNLDHDIRKSLNRIFVSIRKRQSSDMGRNQSELERILIEVIAEL